MADQFKYKPWGEKTLVHEILNNTTHKRTVPDSHLRKHGRQYIMSGDWIHFEVREVTDGIIWVNMIMLYVDIYWLSTKL